MMVQCAGICSSSVCNVVCLSYETLREALASTQEAAYRLCNAVHSMLELYADFTPSHYQDQISALPLVAGAFLCGVFSLNLFLWLFDAHWVRLGFSQRKILGDCWNTFILRTEAILYG